MHDVNACTEFMFSCMQGVLHEDGDMASVEKYRVQIYRPGCGDPSQISL